jgi:hypothetical protein
MNSFEGALIRRADVACLGVSGLPSWRSTISRPKVISRANGSSALASAAYRSASRLHDQRLDRHHDFSNKAGVVHSEVMLPDGAPEHLVDRERLWNAVEAAELRKDAQLAREIEFAIPRELDGGTRASAGARLRRAEFVDRGMIADLNVHWDIGADGRAKPHAHVMLTMREGRQGRLRPKVRDWNRTDLLEKWRERWAEHVNARLAELDIDARIDHRSLEAQGIDLEPQHKIGPAAARMAAQGLESERSSEHLEIARSNGEKIIANPGSRSTRLRARRQRSRRATSRCSRIATAREGSVRPSDGCGARPRPNWWRSARTGAAWTASPAAT